MGSATMETEQPSLVWIEGDIWVVEDYDEPVFYTDGFYWRFNSGVWYRSHAHNQGWVVVTSTPDSIRRIDRPTRYVHYVAPPEARRRGGPAARAPAHEVRSMPPVQERQVAEPPPDRGPPDRAGGGPPPDRGPPEVKAAQGKQDKGPDKGKSDKGGKGDKDKKHDKGHDKK